MKKKNIAKNAKIKKSKIESNNIDIDDKANLIDVYIKAEKIEIQSGVNLTNCKIISNGPVIIGKNSTIKENVVLNVFNGIFIGERTLIDRSVMIGGMQSEKSEFEIGNDCVILYQSYLNTTRKITIGNNVGIGGYCLIFTHSSWQNALEGYPYKFDDVNIQDNVWLPWNVTVFPGVKIEKNVTIGGGSVVTKSLPENVFAAGVPAKIIKKSNNTKLSASKKYSTGLKIMKDFGDYASGFLKLPNSVNKNSKSYYLSFQKMRMVYTVDFKNLWSNDVIVSFKVPNKIKKTHDWIELDSLNAHVSNNIGKQFLIFIKRYGIRIN